MDAIDCLAKKVPFLWLNDHLEKTGPALSGISLGLPDMRDAQARLCRFAPLIMELFPDETGTSGGLIESELVRAPRLGDYLLQGAGPVLIKKDHDLPVAGSVKARGGIYEVLCLAEQLAEKNGHLNPGDNYTRLLEDEVKELFSHYTISVGSTGNLGLSIGIMGAALGFKVDIHMSHEARQWKKERLRKRGVNVVEHQADYSSAVAAGRADAANDPFNFFVDDENSIQLFLGYSVAAFRLKVQLDNLGIEVSEKRPLFVYLPCGIGGAPGGITFGLKQLFGDAVHCFFAEPTEAPCMTLGLVTGKHADISVYDIGLEVRTNADGLAVARPSGFVGKLIAPLLSGALTINDHDMLKYVYAAHQLEGMSIEPSAAAGFAGPKLTLGHDFSRHFEDITHILWTTGGRYVPEEEHRHVLEKGKILFAAEHNN
ncbi:D-serine ammonia-lyase [Geothermobacter hydrogeniphilus]|uniref:Probable D-serine dehydratase n=1 Tax=Geothermobacter hydrogeniphilus TaxID=1969733 RepID=A0A1X0XW93_9BACT|nr:D-serine ammonia-lyase [Geothermobacter hydrogeniphilus]ORJ57139.1 D-serine ammonia-lyase [Geothermobacter hydrogeniphilus]